MLNGCSSPILKIYGGLQCLKIARHTGLSSFVVHTILMDYKKTKIENRKGDPKWKNSIFGR
jgi:transposase